MTAHVPTPHQYVLADRYEQTSGRVFLTGTQALVRIMLDQARRDRAKGLNTAGFVSGYRGSPLGSVDLELWRAKERTAAAGIEFMPAVNEDLAATAVLGTQQVETNKDRTVDGVFAMWYGKGPGVDRSGDALRHGNAYGSSPHGGVLVVAGDDHGCVSSSMPHQSDVAFMAWFMPTLNPASVAEFLAFGEYGYALSRFSGMWVGFKAISETVEAAASVDLAPSREFVLPDFQVPAGGLHYRWPDLPGPQIEERMEAKKKAVFAFAQANPIDRRIFGVANARFGIVTTGKGHLDLMEALRLLGVDGSEAVRLGIEVYKVGMVWPLARQSALEFVRGKEEVLVVEEKRGIIESQFKEYFYDWPGDKPRRMVGKRDEEGRRLVPWTGELSPRELVPILARRLHGLFPGEDFPARAARLRASGASAPTVAGGNRTPYFCSGCPHNRSTVVPSGSRALAGIGCHFMASWMDRDTSSLIQMGGEGVNWAASARFTGNGHVFQNLGEGTWYHSGSMAIRQAVAAGANITYKILFNEAVAMTGGQPVDGPVSVDSIAQSARAEGVSRIAVVTDDVATVGRGRLPPGTTVHHRNDLDRVQRELRDVRGVSVLIYAQACATERRRRRKRGQVPAADRFPVINQAVCEGCGDCSAVSNCLSVEPVETPEGRKRKVNLSSCNTDFSCLEGFCPSFVTVEKAVRRRPDPASMDWRSLEDGLAEPDLPQLDRSFDLMVTGVGGTGVITVGALVAMAAHLDGRGISVLDFTGFAQKFGPVISFLRFGFRPEDLNQVRIDRNAADALIGCDAVVSTSEKATRCFREGMSMVLNTAEMPTGDIVRNRDATLDMDARIALLKRLAGKGPVDTLDANRLAETIFGSTVFANVVMLGAAWQSGLVPVSREALDNAILLNGVDVENNRKAFTLGRAAAKGLLSSRDLLLPEDRVRAAAPPTLDGIIARNVDLLTAYQDAAYAEKYRKTVERLRTAERRLSDFGEDIARTVAQNLYRLMAYKDEYEVSRLLSDPEFTHHLDRTFEPGYRLRFHVAPPFLPAGRDARGRPRKRAFGPWIKPLFRFLAAMKVLRGTVLDPFRLGRDRRLERDLLAWYEALVAECCERLDASNKAQWAKALGAAGEIRGYGPVKEDAARRVRADVELLVPQVRLGGAIRGRCADESVAPP